VENGDNLCKPCAHGAYFKDAREVTWSDMDWTPAPAGSRQRAAGSQQKEAACEQ
jgi:hypothetical protein